MIRAVIFDLDGVLVTTDEYHYQAWKFIADREGIYFDREINHRLRGVSRMASLEVILERASRPYTDAQKHELAETKNNRYRESLSRLAPADALPGAVEMLKALRQRGILLAVGSSSRNAPAILDRTAMASYFHATVDGNDISHSKPDPQVFTLAAERLGVSADECLVVEDAPAGIEAGRRAGMKVLGIGDSHTLPGVQPCVANLAAINVDQLLGVV